MEDLETFVAVVEHGSFTAAAHALGITVTVVSRRIRGLERRLNTRLLNRTTRRVSVTEAGARYHADVRPALEALRDSEARLQQLSSEPSGELRVAAPMSFGIRRLGPLLAQFAAAHPRLRVRLELDDRMVDIVAQGMDLALRIGHLDDSSLVARPILPIPMLLCAAPAYLERHGTPRQAADLTEHVCLHYSIPGQREAWTLREMGRSVTVQVRGGFCSNNGDVLCQAAVAGLGVVLLPEFIVGQDLAAGTLLPLAPGLSAPSVTLYGLYPSRQFVPVKVKLLLDHLMATVV